MSHQDKISFLDLPGEVRAMVYTEIFKESEMGVNFEIDTKQSHRATNTSITRTCQSIRRESLPYLVDTASFALVGVDYGQGLDVSSLPPLLVSSTSQVKHLVMAFATFWNSFPFSFGTVNLSLFPNLQILEIQRASALSKCHRWYHYIEYEDIDRSFHENKDFQMEEVFDDVVTRLEPIYYDPERTYSIWVSVAFIADDGKGDYVRGRINNSRRRLC